MHRASLMAVLLAVACAEAPAPRPIAAPTQRLPPPVPVAASGTAEEQASRRLNRALSQDAQADRFQATGPGAPRQTGEPGANPFDIGGSGQGPAMPDRVSPAFSGGY